MKVIAGIGSRETPQGVLTEMVEIGAWCANHGIWVRSGHAPGADQAFEYGAEQYAISYLPWKGFEGHVKNKARKLVPDNWTQLMQHAKQFHPAWDRLSDGARKMIARDSAQVLGKDLNSPVKAIVCWTKDGRPSGGTGQAIRIAYKLQIPVINMNKDTYPQYATASGVIKALTSLFNEQLELKL
jgi:hypothetical protein